MNREGPDILTTIIRIFSIQRFSSVLDSGYSHQLRIIADKEVHLTIKNSAGFLTLGQRNSTLPLSTLLDKVLTLSQMSLGALTCVSMRGPK